MPPAPLPPDEPVRLASVSRLAAPECISDFELDVLVKKAANALKVPTALVSIVDQRRQWFLARIGMDRASYPREVSFCAYVVAGNEPVVVEDALVDPRVMDNPLVTGMPGIRFYAGVPVHDIDGQPLGALCAIDYQPRRITPHELSTLRSVARAVNARLDLRQTVSEGAQAMVGRGRWPVRLIEEATWPRPTIRV